MVEFAGWLIILLSIPLSTYCEGLFRPEISASHSDIKVPEGIWDLAPPLINVGWAMPTFDRISFSGTVGDAHSTKVGSSIVGNAHPTEVAETKGS
jgi:hypothetical protein